MLYFGQEEVLQRLGSQLPHRGRFLGLAGRKVQTSHRKTSPDLRGERRQSWVNASRKAEVVLSFG